MKPTNSLMTMAFLVLGHALPQPQAYSEETLCLLNHHDIFYAINDFCFSPEVSLAAGGMMVPSDYANTGKRYGNGWAGIPGNCEPPSVVPPAYCALQLYKVCANATGNGANEMSWGEVPCMFFTTGPA